MKIFIKRINEKTIHDKVLEALSNKQNIVLNDESNEFKLTILNNTIKQEGNIITYTMEFSKSKGGKNYFTRQGEIKVTNAKNK
jgi:hypothetical protein